MSKILYIEERTVTHEEKRAWIMLVVNAIAYGVYASIILSRAHGGSLTNVHYAGTLLLTIVIAIVVTIVADIVSGILNRRESRIKDVRDKEIGRLGDRVGQAFVIIGATAAMLMAMADWNRFWIANVIYLGFAISSVLGSLTKVLVYRGRFPEW
jgi:hypothetical protein